MIHAVFDYTIGDWLYSVLMVFWLSSSVLNLDSLKEVRYETLFYCLFVVSWFQFYLFSSLFNNKIYLKKQFPM